MITSTQAQQGAVSLIGGALAYKATQALLNSCFLPKQDKKDALVSKQTISKIINVFSFFAGIAATIYTADRVGLISAKSLFSRVTSYNSTPEKFDQAAFLREMAEMSDE